jgi:hypothetical protein
MSEAESTTASREDRERAILDTLLRLFNPLAEARRRSREWTISASQKGANERAATVDLRAVAPGRWVPVGIHPIGAVVVETPGRKIR